MTALPVFWDRIILALNDKQSATMKTDTAMPLILAEKGGENAKYGAKGNFLRALVHSLRGTIDALCNHMRLVRAYNDLNRLSDRTLRDLGIRPGELERVLNGRRPRGPDRNA